MSYKILSVDDSKTIRMIVKKAFSAFDCDLVEAENGVDGLAAAVRDRPDLIILDITMPVMTGVEMLGKMRSEPELKDIPVIMLTAESGRDSVMQIVKLGVKDYIVKPFKGEQLIERAKKVLKLEPKRGDKSEEEIAALGDRYFSSDGDIQVFSVPAKVSRTQLLELEGVFKTRLSEMTKSGENKLIADLSRLSAVDMSLIQTLVGMIDKCQNAKVHLRLVGNSVLTGEFKKFHETSAIPLHPAYEQARASF